MTPTETPDCKRDAKASFAGPSGSARVYRRDVSWFPNGLGGSANRYHFMGRDLASACGRAMMLDDTRSYGAGTIPTELRCRAKGCAEKWPNAKHQRCETAATDARLAIDLNGWLASAECCG